MTRLRAMLGGKGYTNVAFKACTITFADTSFQNLRLSSRYKRFEP